MWIPSSPCKNRVSDRGRIDIFSHGSISGWKASLLLLALASFYVVCAATGLPEVCNDRDPCFATNKDELESGLSDYIGFNGSEITWDATNGSKEAPSIELYSRECGKLSFIMSMPEKSGDDCKFSMHYPDCDIVLEWSNKDLKFSKEGGGVGLLPGPTVNAELNDTHFTDGKNSFVGPCGFKFQPPKGDGWCNFNFTFNKKTGSSCNGKIQLDTDYKLLATTTTAPATAVPEETNTTKGTAESGLSPWIIVGIVVAVLLLIAAGIGLIVFIICRRKRRGSAQNMIEKGNMVENAKMVEHANMVEYGNAGIDCQCETAISSPVVLKTATSGKKSRSAKVKVSSNETTDDLEWIEWMKTGREAAMKEAEARTTGIGLLPSQLIQKKKVEAKNVPAPSGSSKKKVEAKKVPEPDTSRTVTTPTPSATNEVKDVEVKKDEAKNVPAPSGSSKKKVEAKNVPAPSGSSKKKESEKKKGNHDKNATSRGKGQTE